MTVLELKQAVAGFPDSADVILDIPGFEEFVEFTGTAKQGADFVLICEEPDWEGGEDEADEEDEEDDK